MDYTQLIERLKDAAALPTGLYAEAAQAIEALQARCVELESLNDLAVKQAETLVRLRDAAVAREKHTHKTLDKFMENAARPTPAQPTARTYMDGYSDGKQWALEEAAKVCDSTPPHPFRPSIEAAWAIRKLGEGL